MKSLGNKHATAPLKPILDVRWRNLASFTPFLRPTILKIWREFDKATLRLSEYEKFYPSSE